MVEVSACIFGGDVTCPIGPSTNASLLFFYLQITGGNIHDMRKVNDKMVCSVEDTLDKAR